MHSLHVLSFWPSEHSYANKQNLLKNALKSTLYFLKCFQTLEEPPYLTVGTDVSAKYRGAFCEAKIKSAKRLVKAKVGHSFESRKPRIEKYIICLCCVWRGIQQGSMLWELAKIQEYNVSTVHTGEGAVRVPNIASGVPRTFEGHCSCSSLSFMLCWNR